MERDLTGKAIGRGTVVPRLIGFLSCPDPCVSSFNVICQTPGLDWRGRSHTSCDRMSYVTNLLILMSYVKREALYVKCQNMKISLRSAITCRSQNVNVKMSPCQMSDVKRETIYVKCKNVNIPDVRSHMSNVFRSDNVHIFITSSNSLNKHN